MKAENTPRPRFRSGDSHPSSKTTKITRREFGKTLGGLGIGTMLAAAGCSQPDERNASSERRLNRGSATGQMKLRRLGRTDLQLSPVGFGAQRTRDADLVRYALDQGINHIETAWGYGFGRPGNSCECLGKAIAGRRDSVCLAVAFEAAAPPRSKAWLPNQFEQCLRDLGTDHIDVFLWHDQSGRVVDNRALTSEEIRALFTEGERVELMLKWKAQGKLRWCGLTTHQAQPEWLEFVVQSKLYDVAVVAFNYQSPKAVAEAMREAWRKEIGLIAMKTQSPNHLQGTTIGDAPDHRAALSWVLSKDYITAAIPGMTTRDQVDLNLKTMRSMA